MGSGSQTGAGGDFPADLAADAAAGSDCRLRCEVHDFVHHRIALWRRCRPGVRLLGGMALRADATSSVGLGRWRLLALAPRPRGVGGVLVAQWGGGVSGTDSTVWEVGAPEGKSFFECPESLANRPGRARNRPGGPQDAAVLRFCSSGAQGRLQLGGIDVELLQEGTELQGWQGVDGVEELQILAHLCFGAGRIGPSRSGDRAPGQERPVELERRDVGVDDLLDVRWRREGRKRGQRHARRGRGRVQSVGCRLNPRDVGRGRSRSGGRRMRRGRHRCRMVQCIHERSRRDHHEDKAGQHDGRREDPAPLALFALLPGSGPAGSTGDGALGRCRLAGLFPLCRRVGGDVGLRFESVRSGAFRPAPLPRLLRPTSRSGPLRARIPALARSPALALRLAPALARTRPPVPRLLQ